MQQRLVAWGDIGTDHKALLAIEFDASEHKVKFHAFPEEKVDLELQHRLFTIWKNGGELEFPDGITTWETDAEFSHLLPENIKLHKPELLVQAQEQWNKIQEHENNFKLLGERLHLLELELDTLKSFNQDLWNKTRSLWEEISGQKRDGHLGWTHADELKIRINQVFDGLKAFRRLNKEKNFDESKALHTLLKKQIREEAEKLIYPDEWKNIFKNLQGIQKKMKDAPLLYKHRRGLMQQLNVVFGDLRKYRKSDQINHIEDRIYGLERVLRGIEKSIDRDEQSYKNQFEKMKHYTRGKMSDADIEEQLKYLKEQGKAKQKKLKSIGKTIRSLEKKLESLKNPPKKEAKPAKKKTKKDKKQPAADNGKAPAADKQAAGEDAPGPGTDADKKPKATAKKATSETEPAQPASKVVPEQPEAAEAPADETAQAPVARKAAQEQPDQPAPADAAEPKEAEAPAAKVADTTSKEEEKTGETENPEIPEPAALKQADVPEAETAPELPDDGQAPVETEKPVKAKKKKKPEPKQEADARPAASRAVKISPEPENPEVPDQEDLKQAEQPEAETPAESPDDGKAAVKPEKPVKTKMKQKPETKKKADAAPADAGDGEADASVNTGKSGDGEAAARQEDDTGDEKAADAS